MTTTCQGCHANAETTELKTCSVCQNVKYCSAACQKDDWSSHKADCTRKACLALFSAIQANDGDTVTRLAKTKRVLNGKVDYTPPVTENTPQPRLMGKWTALHECVRIKNPDMMQILLNQGAKVEISDVDGETPAFVACTCDDPAMIRTLLHGGANPNGVAADGWSYLMMAARDGNYEIVKALLEAGASDNGAADMFGRSAIDLVAAQMEGMALRMTVGETPEQAKERARKVHALLLEYA